MPYLPPHLRGGAGGAESGPSSDTAGASGGARGGYGGGGGGGGGYRDAGSRPSSGFGRRDDSFGGSREMQKSGSQSSFGGGGLSRSGSAAVLADGDQGGSRQGSLPRPGSSAQIKWEPIFAAWSPSERVQSLSVEQIVDIRQRLNITVEVREGQPDCPCPIESFHEMVSALILTRNCQVVYQDLCSLSDLSIIACAA